MNIRTLILGGLLATMTPTCFAVDTDFDADGRTGFSDFLTLSSNFGKQPATHAEGDANFDGMVSFADFLSVSAAFNAGNDVLVNYEAGDTITSCTAVICDYDDSDPEHEVLTVNPAPNSDAYANFATDLSFPFDANDVVVRIGNHDVAIFPNKRSHLDKLEVHGTPSNDHINCTDTSASMLDIYGEEGHDRLDGRTESSNSRERFIGGPGIDQIYGFNHSYLIDDDPADNIVTSNTGAKAKRINNLVWEWKSGDVTETQWDGIVKAPGFLFTSNEWQSESNGTPAGFPLPNANNYLQVPVNYIAPRILSNSDLRARIRSVTPNPHSMIRIWDTGLPGVFYLHEKKRYRLKFKADTSTPTNWDNVD